MSFTLYWIRTDNQGSIEIGEYPTMESAVAAIQTAQAELVSQCPGPHDENNDEFTQSRDEILNGRWTVEETK